MLKLNMLKLPNTFKSVRTSIGTVVEWAEDGRRMITYPQNHKYFRNHGITQAEIAIDGKDKTVSFFRNGKLTWQGYTLYSPKKRGMIGNLGEIIRELNMLG